MFPLTLVWLLMHPVHETVSEIEWNQKSGRLEVSLRLDVLDEQWLKKKYAGEKGDEEGDIASWGMEYVRKRFRVATPPREGQPDPTSYHWVGRNQEGPFAWWHFEIVPADGQRPTWIDLQVLFDREQTYHHRVLVLDQVPRRSLTLTIQRPKANLDQAQDEPETAPPTNRRSHLDWRRNDKWRAAGYQCPMVESADWRTWRARRLSQHRWRYA